MATQIDNDPLDLREQLARIDQMRASTEKAIAEIQKVRVDTKLVSYATIFQGLIAVAALIGAGAAIAKLFFP